MSPQPRPDGDNDPVLIDAFAIENPGDVDDAGLDPQEAAWMDLEAASYATFEQAIDTITEDSLEPSVLTGFNDITREQAKRLKTVWKTLDEEARRVIAEHVAILGDDDLRLDFMRFFQAIQDDDSAAVRQIAASGLSPYDDPALIASLGTMAERDSDQDVRLAAIESLAGFSEMADFGMLGNRDLKYLRNLLARLISDRKAPAAIRAAALVSAAGDSQTPGLQTKIEEMFDDGDADLRQGALRAMGRFTLPRWLPLLERAARSQDIDDREAAAWSLGPFEDESVVPVLTMMAREDQEAPVRIAAIGALGVHGGRAALESLSTLVEYVSDDEVPYVEDAIAQAEDVLAIEDGADEWMLDGDDDEADK